MGDNFDIKAIITKIDTNCDENITQEELQKAEGKVASVWLEKITSLAAGNDIGCDKVLKGLGVEPEVKSTSQKGTTFIKENYFDYEQENTEPGVAKTFEDIPARASWIRDARRCNISQLNLSETELLNLIIDKTTILSDEQRQIIDEAMENMKNPGLGIRALHERGITGKGVKIAIIDQPLGMHKEYSENIIHHESINCEELGWNTASMHGAAVASIAVGKETGVAPDADLLYFSAVNITNDKSSIAQYMADLKEKINNENCSEPVKAWYKEMLEEAQSGEDIVSNLSYAEAIEKILDMNKNLSDAEKIPVISISWGFSTVAPGYEKLQEVLKRAKDEGVFVVSTALEETHGFCTNGVNRNPQADPDNPQSYEAGAFWKDIPNASENIKDSLLLIPMDHRTTADYRDGSSFRYEGNDGGMSWSTPWLAATYALAKQVNRDVTPEEFWHKALETSDECRNNDDGKYVGRLINPQKLMEAIKK